VSNPEDKQKKGLDACQQATLINSDRTTDSLSRRHFLQRAGATAGLVVAPAFLGSARGDSLHLNSELFTLGVASGDPFPHSVVLWTRLAPEPLNGGGMPDKAVKVIWEVAEDYGMKRVIKRGQTVAHPQHGHAVRVVARGLPSDKWLYYRFKAMGMQSRVGRTRTFPGKWDGAERMRFALVSCQNYNQGFYPAYRDMLDKELDFVLHTGDYIYEDGPAAIEIAPGRSHTGGEIFTLDDYRERYALYKLDQDLQDVHAQMPFIVTWDDHEVDNNYAGKIAEEGAPFQGDDFALRRRNAYQVYSETMPLRPRNRSHGKHNSMKLFRKLPFGDLAEIFMLDTRQFRTDQPAEDVFGSTDPNSIAVEPFVGEKLYDAEGILNEEASMMGRWQERWLERGLKRSRAAWNVLAQQVMVMPWNLVKTTKAFVAAGLESQPIPPEQKAQILAAFDHIDNVLNVDAWDGYEAARQRLFELLDRTKPSNPVILSGDIHSAWGAELFSDFSDTNSDRLAVEFVCTSISSTFLELDPRPIDYIVRLGLQDNPHINYFNGLFRGYSLCDVDRDRWQTTYRAVGDLTALADIDNPLALVPYPDSPVDTDAVLEVKSGFSEPGSSERLETTFARSFG
jgi:alkaline phosphatase D